jgi:hypothetical protein
MDDKNPAREALPTHVAQLARDHSEAALQKLVQLLESPNDCIAFGAVRVLLERGLGRVPAGTPEHMKPQPDPGLTVKITRFKEGDDDGSIRHHDLPVVYGGWQGPRDLRDDGGSGMPKVRRKREGARHEPRIRDGTTPGLQGTGAEAGRGGGAPAARAKRSTVEAETQGKKGA